MTRPRPDTSARVSDVRTLRALAHPLRARLLGLLRVDGPSTASRLAALVGESSGSTSYHLRQLAAYGFVVEQTGQGSGRERWWQAEHAMTTWEPDELAGQPGGREAGEQMQKLQIELMGRELRAWADAGPQQDEQWARAAGLSDYVLRLSPEQTRSLLRELYAVLERWSSDVRDPEPDAAPVNVFVAAVPRTVP